MSSTALIRPSTSSTSLTAPTAQNRSMTSSSSPASTTTTTTTTVATRPTSTPSTQGTPARTPTSQQQQASPAPSTPGRWEHPRLNEILRRQNRSRFDQSNVSAIMYNAAFLVLTFFVPTLLNTMLPTTWTEQTLNNIYATTILLILPRAFFLLNIALALTPLFRTPDPCTDIPLTPSQRHLLGLPPMSRPATPQEKEQYVTPPRYARTPPTTGGSAGGSGGLRSVSTSGWQGRRSSGGVAGGGALGKERRRLSYNALPTRSSPLGGSELENVGLGTNTPTKREGSLHRASVGLNSKWLYEKGKAVPGVITGAGGGGGGVVGLAGSGWGTGSVFS